MPHFFEYALPTVMWLIFTQQPFQRLGWTLWYRCGDGYLRGTSWFYGLRRCCSLVMEWLVQEGGKGGKWSIKWKTPLSWRNLGSFGDDDFYSYFLDCWLLEGSFDCLLCWYVSFWQWVFWLSREVVTCQSSDWRGYPHWFWEMQQECLTWGSSGYPLTNPLYPLS